MDMDHGGCEFCKELGCWGDCRKPKTREVKCVKCTTIMQYVWPQPITIALDDGRVFNPLCTKCNAAFHAHLLDSWLHK